MYLILIGKANCFLRPRFAVNTRIQAEIILTNSNWTRADTRDDLPELWTKGTDHAHIVPVAWLDSAADIIEDMP